MIELVLAGAAFVLVAGLAFAVAIRLGILVGRRLDVAIEARALREDGTADGTVPEPAAAHQNPSPVPIRGREEHHVE